MSLAVRGSISLSLFDLQAAPSTPSSDFLDLSDNLDTPGTTHSFQDPLQHKSVNMQAEPTQHLLPGLLDHHILPTTDDEMMDSDADIRKDSDFDIEIDADEVYSNAGGVDLDVNYHMEEDNTDNTHQLYDNDDIMLDEDDTTLDEKQAQVDNETEPTSNTAPTITVPEASLDTLPEEQSTVLLDEPNNTHSVPATALEEAPLTDRPLLSMEEPEADETIQPTEVQHSGSPTEESHDTLALPDNVEQAIAHENIAQDSDLQRRDNVWSENTSVTLANEAVPLEEQQTNDETAEQHHQPITTGSEAEEQGIVGLANEPPSFDPHPVVVQYEQNHVSLFPPPNDVDLPFFIKDVDVCLKGIDVLFLELRNVLDGSVSPGDELVIKIVDYGVEISEDSKSSHEFSLQHILDLHVRLSLQDNIENPEALRLVLYSRPSMSDRINMLLNSANEGLGYNKAIEYARGKLEDSDLNSEQRFIEASEGEDLQEAGIDERIIDDSPTAFAYDTDKPAEVEPNRTEEQEGSASEQKEEVEEEDDDDFDLEYGTDDVAHGAEGGEDEGGVILKDESSNSPPLTEAVSKGSPVPASGSPNYTPRSPTAEVTTVLELETVSDNGSEKDTQTPDEVEESVSTVQADETRSIQGDEEELIEYEDYEEYEESESHYTPHTIVSEYAEQHLDENEQSPRGVLDEQEGAEPSGTIENYEEEPTGVTTAHTRDNTGDDNHEGYHSPENDATNETTEPSLIPVFGGNGDDEGDYAEKQQEEYAEYEYGDQHDFEASEDGNQDHTLEDERHNLQEPSENDHEANIQEHGHLGEGDRSADDQNQYLGESNEFEDGYKHYGADYNGVVNEQGDPTGEVEYGVDYQNYGNNQVQPQPEYDDDAVTGGANGSGVVLGGDDGDALNSLYPLEAVPEEESLLGYDSDEGESYNPFAQAVKSGTEQKRMRDELEQGEDDEDDEIIAKRHRSD